MESIQDKKYVYHERNFINKLNFFENNKDLLLGTENGILVEYERIK
jgi:hypothetical protein